VIAAEIEQKHLAKAKCLKENDMTIKKVKKANFCNVVNCDSRNINNRIKNALEQMELSITEDEEYFYIEIDN